MILRQEERMRFLVANRGPTAVVFAVVSMLWLADASAQSRLSVEAGVGFSAPAGELARRQEFGTTVGLSVGYRVNNGWAVKASTEVEMLEGTFVNMVERSAPMTLAHFGIGAERRVIRSSTGHWEILGEVGAGRTSMRTVGVGNGRVVDRPFGHSCNSSLVGLTTLTRPSRRATVVLRGRIRWMMTDRAQTEGLAGSLPFSAAYTLPITVGLVLSL
jgi:hypothetical protein